MVRLEQWINSLLADLQRFHLEFSLFGLFDHSSRDLLSFKLKLMVWFTSENCGYWWNWYWVFRAKLKIVPLWTIWRPQTQRLFTTQLQI